MEENFIFWRENGQIVPHLLYEFFIEKGIGKYFPDDTNKKNTEPVLIKLNGNIVSPVNIGYLLELTKEYILSTIGYSVLIEPSYTHQIDPPKLTALF
jgi:hypothetical protein